MDQRQKCLTKQFKKDFIADYNKFAQEFDEVAKDHFQGLKLDRLVNDFLAKYGDYMKGFEFTVKTSFPECGISETNNEDLRIVLEGVTESGSDDSGVAQQHQQVVVEKTPEYAVLLADVYTKACQACHLRITWNKSRLNKEEDRLEPLQFGRYAIRYDPYSYPACYWYMISLGWHLDVLTNAKERATISKLFYQSVLRCIRLDPKHPCTYLAYNLLGRYYYYVNQVSWFERKLANAMLGCQLEGTYEDAERAFLKSYELRENWLPHGLWMARVLLAQKKPIEEVKRWIDYSLKLECEEPTGEISRNEILELRSQLKLSTR